ncbi:MAG: protein kinase [Planctomycetes bacterium]|nr:protein kinase [Planctomycetota bacterium]
MKQSSDKSKLWTVKSSESSKTKYRLILKEGITKEGQEQICTEAVIYPQIMKYNYLRKYTTRFLQRNTGEKAEHKYIVLEYFDGSHLGSLLFHNKLNFIHKLQACIQLIDFIQQLSALQIAHRDIRPSNIMMNIKEGTFKIIDYGQAVLFDQKKQGKCSSRNWRPIDASLGKDWTAKQSLEQAFYVIFKIMTGKSPWNANDRGVELRNSKKLFWDWADRPETKFPIFDNIKHSESIRPTLGLFATFMKAEGKEESIQESLYLNLKTKLVADSAANRRISNQLSTL